MTLKFQKFPLGFCALSSARTFLNFSILTLCVGIGPFSVGCSDNGAQPGKIAVASPTTGTAANAAHAPDRAKEEKLVLDELDKFAGKFSMPGLRKKPLLAGEREMRIWIGMGPDKTRGLILGNDRATYLAPVGDVGQERPAIPQHLRPRSGWGPFWDDITATGLIELPAEPASEDVDPRNDSDVIVVERKTGTEYEYILYGAACYSNGRNAAQLIAAIEKIGRGLELEFYQCPSN